MLDTVSTFYDIISQEKIDDTGVGNIMLLGRK
jgi:hypothetical protein